MIDVKYLVTYKSITEIIAEYSPEEIPTDKSALYECVLVKGTQHFVKFIKMDVPDITMETTPFLQRMIRCYIIDSYDIPLELPIAEMLYRYG